MSMNVIETSRLGKRYGTTWALRECTLALLRDLMNVARGRRQCQLTTRPPFTPIIWPVT